MAEYALISNNYTGIGNLGISTKCIEQIVTKIISKIEGVSEEGTVKLSRGVECSINNNKVFVHIHVVIKKGNSIDEICNIIQKDVADGLTMMLEMIPFSIKIKIVGIE